MSTLVTQGGPKRDTWSFKGDPKSIRMALGNPLDHKAGSRRKRDLERNSNYQPFWFPWPPVGAPRSHFGSQWGSKKGSKSTWGGKVGTFGGQGGPKGSSKGGSEWVRKRLGGGVRFENRVPRAASRARLINKSIKFRKDVTRRGSTRKRILKAGDLTRRGPKGLANFIVLITFLLLWAIPSNLV